MQLLNMLLGDCLRAGKTIVPASPSLAQRAVKKMSSHTMDLAVYVESSSSSCWQMMSTSIACVCAAEGNFKHMLK